MSGFAIDSGVVDAGRARLIISGDLDLAAVGTLTHDAGGRLERADCTTVVLDLEAVTFIDSSGLGCLVSLHHRAREAGKQVVLCNVPTQVSRLLAFTALDTLLDVHPAADVPAVAPSGPASPGQDQPTAPRGLPRTASPRADARLSGATDA